LSRINLVTDSGEIVVSQMTRKKVNNQLFWPQICLNYGNSILLLSLLRRGNRYMADLFMMDNATWIKILSKGVITIPKEFREAINLKDGDIAKAWIEGNRLILEPFRGSLGAEEPQVQVVQETPLRQDSAGPASTRGEQAKEEKKVVQQEPMDVLEKLKNSKRRRRCLF
jgi:AbrB family looped-hinge helix DNA binding protein